jgi:threonine dehydrogenase-like Zn-dependent dehydrogenase
VWQALKEGETVLVLGASGGVGLAAVQLAKALNAKVIAACSDESKMALCKANGADVVINYGTDGKDFKQVIPVLARTTTPLACSFPRLLSDHPTPWSTAHAFITAQTLFVRRRSRTHALLA